MSASPTTRIDEIAPDVFRLSTYLDVVAPPAGFTFNQFLVRGDEPFLFHTGQRQLFPFVSDAVARLVDLADLRWISFAHVEADECGSVNQFLAAAPRADVTHGPLACMVSLNDMLDRPPVPVADDVLYIGAHRLRFVPTPHVPHNWESGLWFDETTRTLLAGDLFTGLGDPVALVEDDLVEAAMVGEQAFHYTSIGPSVPSTIAMLADLEPQVIACMHGSSFRGAGGEQLRRLARSYEGMLSAVG